MHNRDMKWGTADGRTLILRDISSDHLTNIEKHINKNFDQFISKFGEEKTKIAIYNVTQEIRLRKLNRLDNNNEEELF